MNVSENIPNNLLDFEKPIIELENKIEGLRRLNGLEGINIADEVSHLEGKLNKQIRQIYSKLSPWQKTQIARHPNRPHCMDYISALFKEFTPLAGDRLFAEDKAVVGGLARFDDTSVMVIGLEKGSDTETRISHNFGMAKPEGYRKAKRLMEMANHFKLPVITLVDTAGAYPGIDAEERGQGEAIAACIETALSIDVPLIACIIGEGGSGGAIALATGNKIIMLEHSIYSVISPEGCASILWRDREMAKTASEALKLTAQDLKEMNIIDEIIPEPLGGAHRHREIVIKSVEEALKKALNEFKNIPENRIKAMRRDKFLKMTRS